MLNPQHLTITRLNKEISEGTLKLINQKFKDILTKGDIRASLPTSKEVQEKEYLDLPRLVMHFNMRDYGRLSEMIHALNKDFL